MLYKDTINIDEKTNILTVDCQIALPHAKTVLRTTSTSEQIHDLLNNSIDYTVIVCIDKNRWIDFYLELFDIYSIQHWLMILNERLSIKFIEILNETNSYDNDNDDYKFKVIDNMVHIYKS